MRTLPADPTRYRAGYDHALRVFRPSDVAQLDHVAGWRGPMPENDGAAAGLVAMACGVDLGCRS